MDGHTDLGLLEPYYSFPDVDEFVWRHGQATIIEMDNEELVVKRLNSKRQPFKAWPVSPIPGLATPFFKSWLFLVKQPSGGGDEFPALTDRFTIDMERRVSRREGIFTLVHMPATRIPNPYEYLCCGGGAEVSKCAAFKVDVPRSWLNADGVHVEMDLMANFQTCKSINDTENIMVRNGNHQTITIQWEVNNLTFEAELAALHHLTNTHRLEELAPTTRSLDAFRMIQDFEFSGRVVYTNLHDEYPQLQDPAHPLHPVPRVLIDKFFAFNAEHRMAFDGLKEIPNGLYFVNGCPGAGKTEWNMRIDISLCKEAGLDLRIIRMHGWPYEMRNSSKLSKACPENNGDSEAETDFTKRFLTTVSMAYHAGSCRSPDVAPTLDEASWEYYERHKNDNFPVLKRLLSRLDDGQIFDNDDWKVLRSQVSLLYRIVLGRADFVATTPVAAYGRFSKMFRPDLVFVDEAPHARELSTLIAIAFFSPRAWIFTGDVHQTRPFVKSGNKKQADREGLRFNTFAEQLRVSTMARAVALGATSAKFLINKRSYGNLHRLPSQLFYSSEMISGYCKRLMYPPGVLYMKSYLEGLGSAADIEENRLVVHLRESCEQMFRSSFWNPAHHEWILKQAQTLTEDEEFVGIDGYEQGTIMIITPYSTAVREYHKSVKKWPQEVQDRVEVLTVDKAQGKQADVVFLDLVRTSWAGFMDDPYRLNVAITRARQAEVIVIHPRMTWSHVQRGLWFRARYLSQIWDDALRHRRMISL